MSKISPKGERKTGDGGDMVAVRSKPSQSELRAIADKSVDTIINATLHGIRETSKVSDEALMTLNFFYGKTFVKALGTTVLVTENNLIVSKDIVDSESITKIRAKPSEREIFAVEGSAAFPYIVTHSWCSCPAFNKTLHSAKGLDTCKHQIAVRLADATGELQIVEVEDSDFAKRILEDRNKGIESLARRLKPQLDEAGKTFGSPSNI